MKNTVIQGDALEGLRTLPNEAVNCCVTSPPYWGLRNYGVDGQLGLEKTPEEYIGKMVEVFREVRRVLRSDGTLWLNLGDSYAGSQMSGGDGSSSTLNGTHHRARSGNWNNRKDHGLKPKDLCMIPARVALALQADGWWLRSVIIWNKPNPMPESVTDRPTTAHEYIYLLAKSEKYYYDAAAIAEPLAEASIDRLSQNVECQIGSDRVPGKTNGRMKAVYKKEGRNSRFHQDRDPQHSSERKVRKHDGTNHGSDGSGFQGHVGNSLNRPDGKRNKRSVWTIATQPYKEAHFATFPEKLIEPCILAGCPQDGIVLDPFMGSGTTGAVALRLWRNFVGIELNPEYIKLAKKRIAPHIQKTRLAL